MKFKPSFNNRLKEGFLYSQKNPCLSQEPGENGPKSGKSVEPVVHFKEWTTSSWEKAETGPKSGKSAEPVDHFGEWTTSSQEPAGNRPKSREIVEPVVHFFEWTTSSGKPKKTPFLAQGRPRLSLT